MSGYVRMRRDLTLPIVPAPLPDGTVLQLFTKEFAYESRELMKRVYPDGLGDGGISFEGFWMWLTTDAEFDPDLMFIATYGGAVAGFCHCWTSSFIKDVVVGPEHRRRGLGAALITHALLAFVGRGASFVDLKTEVDNIQAQSLYRRLGFVVVAKES